MRNRQDGQAVLIVLLSMVVALTVVLSVIASSTADIKISANETTSLRAFSAAESGIEQALISDSAGSGSVNSGATFNASIAGFALGKSSVVYPANIVSGDIATIWFVSHGSNGSLICNTSNPCFTGRTINICWGAAGSASNLSTTPAIEVSAFYLTIPGNSATAKFVKAAFDANATRLFDNGFLAADPGTCTIGTTQFQFQKTIDLSTLGVPILSYNSISGLQFMTIKLLYNTSLPQPVGINVNFAGNTTLPSQGRQVDSTGVLSQASRKIEVIRSYNQIPPVFDAAVFSPQGVIK